MLIYFFYLSILKKYVKLLYILFWTWILNLMCKAGATEIAWFLVLLPLIIFFLLISVLLSYQSAIL